MQWVIRVLEILTQLETACRCNSEFVNSVPTFAHVIHTCRASIDHFKGLRTLGRPQNVFWLRTAAEPGDVPPKRGTLSCYLPTHHLLTRCTTL